MGARYVRRAGRAGLLHGSVLLWSIAEGARGARWRASTRRGDGLLSHLLLEVGRDGRPGRLEITTAAGQLTLHPAPDGLSAHGNVVSARGVRPLVHEWSTRHWFGSRESPVMAAAMVRSLRGEMGVGEFRVVPGLHVEDDLQVGQGQRGVRRLTDARWQIEEIDGFEWALNVDEEGLPMFEAGNRPDAGSTAAPVWPLEVDGAG